MRRLLPLVVDSPRAYVSGRAVPLRALLHGDDVGRLVVSGHVWPWANPPEQRDPREQFFFDGHEALTATMREGFGDLGWWFDTAALTPEESAQRVVDHAYDLARTGRRGL